MWSSLRPSIGSAKVRTLIARPGLSCGRTCRLTHRMSTPSCMTTAWSRSVSRRERWADERGQDHAQAARQQLEQESVFPSFGGTQGRELSPGGLDHRRAAGRSTPDWPYALTRWTLRKPLFSARSSSRASRAAVASSKASACANRPLETVAIESGVRGIIYRAKEHFEAPNWSRDGKMFFYNTAVGRSTRCQSPAARPRGWISRAQPKPLQQRSPASRPTGDGWRSASTDPELRQSVVSVLSSQGGTPGRAHAAGIVPLTGTGGRPTDRRQACCANMQR